VSAKALEDRRNEKDREQMTLQQLRYVIAVAETGTITEAANRLYISQPSLTNAIHELEKEMNVVIFNRTNKGITLSKEGEDFLGYARQVLEQAAILEDRYKGSGGGKKQFCVSTQHYSFAVNAFVDLIKTYGQEEYDFSLRETQTYEIIEDVAKMKSEIGILFQNDFNEAVIGKLLKSHDLEFHLLFVAKPHVFISRKHPLAEKNVITNEELEQYPYLSFEQGEHNSFYFSEEIFSPSERKKNIRVRDRATLFNLLIGLNGYTVCSGVIDKKLNGKDIIAVPLADESEMRIGYIVHKKGVLSRLGNTYLDALNKYLE
jgi:DNA-binding transcriptional LysR family regulator